MGHLAQRPGSIVNLTAIQEHLPLPTHVMYVATKGALSALTRALAVELGPLGVRVNAVAPGAIETPGMAEERAAVERRGGDAGGTEAGSPTLLGFPGTPVDVAAAVAFLASADAAYITGEILTVDGGRRLSRAPDPLWASPAASDAELGA
jgi:NAD(P)-dependent dehydrogenase (short-subunit alcohol dehydrogenase family)